MRGTTDHVQPFVMVESLENRTLLSADWVGTWQVQGTDLSMRSLGVSGALAVTKPVVTVAITETAPDTYIAVLSTKNREPRTYTLQSDATGLVGDFTEFDPVTNEHSKLYIRMMKVDDSVRMFDMTSVGYTDSNGTQRIQWVNMYAGVASQQKLQVVKFPYAGNYSFHGFQLVAGTQGGTLNVAADYADSPGIIAAGAARGRYNITTTIDDNQQVTDEFRDRAGRLSRVVAGPTTGGTYARYLQMYYRGPDGRLYYRGGGMEANTNTQRTDALGAIPTGQILDGWTMAGYSDVAPYNFAPVLTPAPVALNPTTQGLANDQGTSVHKLLIDSAVTDWNGGNARGIAITSASSRYGTWEYSTNGGASWQLVGRVSTGKALLLTDSNQNLIRLVPKAGFTGTIAKAIGFRAWDQSVGANDQRVSAARAGNLTAFSKARNYASLQIHPVPAPLPASVFSDAPLMAEAAELLV